MLLVPVEFDTSSLKVRAEAYHGDRQERSARTAGDGPTDILGGIRPSI
jgi:hypothetical protein